jgi:hypothetical protein
MAAPVEHGFGLLATGDSGQRQFRKHKVLPRPRSQQEADYEYLDSTEQKFGLALDGATISSGSSRSSSPVRELKHKHRRISAGPEPPPTPPAHSRTSSSSHSAIPSSPTINDHNLSTPRPRNAQAPPPTTPPDQRSPPTPDVTPPQPESRPRALRPSFVKRGTSRSKISESRTESFTTAREEPLSSEEEEVDDGQSTARPTLTSGRTSQQTVRKVSTPSNINRIAHPQALDMALAQLGNHSQDIETPRTRREFGKFDGEWGVKDEIEIEGEKDLNRSVTVSLRNVSATSPSSNRYRRGIVDDGDMEITPAKASKAVRQRSLHEQTGAGSPKRQASSARSAPPTNSDISVATTKKRSSAASSRSVSSTVEAFLIDGRPQRQRTLRHVRKQSELRHSITNTLLNDETAAEPGLVKRPIVPIARPERGRRHESYASQSTVNTVGSGKARREVWKSGAIPVVVVPDRRSSNRSTSREPSLRSTSSRRSKRTMSLGSTPMDGPTSKETGPVFDRTKRRSRTLSLSDHSEWTIDLPPAIPTRSSSLSAPTSRNVSRAGSMTAESVRARDLIRNHSMRQISLERPAEDLLLPPLIPTEMISIKVEHAEPSEPRETDHFDETTSLKKFTPRNTPFSIVSVETNGTAPEVSEAMAVHMYSHQNSSVLMVNHSNKPSDASDLCHMAKEAQGSDDDSNAIYSTPRGAALPMTPPQPQIPQFALEDVDSPLRNPRAPPEPPIQPPNHPPALAFIPATPSGVTPGPDVAIQMGNFYEAMAEQPPQRRPSFVRRALGRPQRDPAEYPPNSSRTPRFLSRALSLTRRRSSSRTREFSDLPPYRTDFPQEGDEPREGTKLHPFWTPRWSGDEFDDDDEWYHRRRSRDDEEEEEEEDEYLRYPLVDNRPSKPRRSFSEKVKQTLASSFPAREERYVADDGTGPERRTIRRTSSGNLRVIRRLSSIESLSRRFSYHDRPATAPEREGRRSFWRGTSVHQRIRDSSRRRRNSLGEHFEEIQNLPRKLSERRREKRSRELRQQISGPTEVRDGVEDVIRSGYNRDNGNINRI